MVLCTRKGGMQTSDLVQSPQKLVADSYCVALIAVGNNQIPSKTIGQKVTWNSVRLGVGLVSNHIAEEKIL